MGPLPETDEGSKYVLVAVDCYTRWMEVYGIPNQEATTVARRLVDETFCRFSPPEQLHSDQGRVRIGTCKGNVQPARGEKDTYDTLPPTCRAMGWWKGSIELCSTCFQPLLEITLRAGNITHGKSVRPIILASSLFGL